MPLDRTWYNTLVDDSGGGTDGTIIDKADIDALMDAVDAALLGIGAPTDLLLTTLSPAALVANTNDYSPGAGTLVSIQATTPINLTGMVSTGANQVRILANIAAATITIKHESGLSLAANRFYTAAGTDIVLATNAFRLFVYHSAVGRWRPMIDG
jgi:hypothetical protein